MKQGLKTFLAILTIISILIAVFVTSIKIVGNKQYFDVRYNDFRIREGDNVTYFDITSHGYNLVLRATRAHIGTLHLNQDGQAVGSVPVTMVSWTSDKLAFRIEDTGFNIIKIVDIINNHVQGTFPSFPTFDFSGGFFSDLAVVVRGVFDVLYYPFEVTIYIIDTLIGSFKLFGGGFKL